MIYLVTKKTTYQDQLTFSILTNLQDIIEPLSKCTELCLDTETEGLNPLKHKIIMLQLGTSNKDQYIIDCRDFDVSELRSLLENPNILFIGHNIKFDYNMLKQYDIVLNNVYDTMIVDQVLHNGKYSPDQIRKTKRYSLAGVYKFYTGKEIEKTVRDEFPYIKEHPFSLKQILYGANDVVFPFEIKKKQIREVDFLQLQNKVKLENRVLLSLGDMEYNGFKIDSKKFLSFVTIYKGKKLQTEKELDEYLIAKNPKYKKQAVQLDLFGLKDHRLTDVQWNSSQQVLKILKNEFNIEAKDKYGKISSGANAFSILDYSKYDPILDLILKFREQEKIITSFGEDYIRKFVHSDGRIHTQFNQIVETGRMSSRTPNIQQIPKGEHRNSFISEEGYKLSCADYSSQEARIMADLSGDSNYIEFFKSGGFDIHSFVATKMFSAKFKKEFIVTIDNENKEYRQKGKTLNFGISFGMSSYTLAKTLHISEDEAQSLIDSFYKAFPTLKIFFEEAKKFGVENGYIRTNPIINGIRWFKEYEDLNSPSIKDRIEIQKIKGSIERRSMNTKIQGSAAEMTKIALVLFRDKLLSNNIRPLKDALVKLICAIHDEIVIEAVENLIEDYSKVQKECMEKAGEVICKQVKITSIPLISSYWTH